MRIALLATLVLLGCSSTQVPLPPGAKSTLRVDYSDLLKENTRSEETYEYFESRVFVKATYFSKGFAEAYARQRAERLGLSPNEYAAERKRLVEATKDEVRVFIQVVTNDFFWNDLDNPKGTLRARLIVDGEPVAPKRLWRLTDNAMADLTPFFPYVSMLARGYWAIFPRPNTDVVQLRIAGPPAIIDLEWPR